MIRAILFDFTQTLVDSSIGFRSAEKKAKIDLFSYLGLTDWDEFLKKYRQIRSEFSRRSISSRLVIWRAVCVYFGQIGDDILFENWEYEYWVTVDQATLLFPETLTVIEELAMTYKLGIVSNIQGQPKKSPKHFLGSNDMLDPYFQSVIIAGEKSIPVKPKHEPFEVCLNQLGVKASESIYVGDDWRNDIMGSMGAGLQPVWIKHYSVERNWPEPEYAVPTITSLDQLLDHALLS